MASTENINTDKTRILLILWDLDAQNQGVKKGELSKKLVNTKKKTAYYKPIFEQLESVGAIAINKNLITLSDQGVKMLGEGLQNPDFMFTGSLTGTKNANAVLKWLRSQPQILVKTEIKPEAIANYDQFKQVVLEVHERLNSDHNLKNIVPIYRMRREIGDRTSRREFNEWLLEMQADDIFQLIAGEMANITPDKREDSINIEGVGFRYYAKRLNAE
jgi:hypothetical protein